MIFITGDTHAVFHRFSIRNFPEQKEMTKNDCVIICGDFGGVWKDSPEERYWLDWLNDRPFTILFVDGNHENFDRYYSNEFEKSKYCDGEVQIIRPSIYHLLRGEMYNIQGRKFFTFGGASSHDIKDGVLDIDDYSSEKEFIKEYREMTSEGKMFRVNHVSWWEQELPSNKEMQHGIDTLKANNNVVDFIVTHCLPQEIASIFSMGLYEPDTLTMYFNRILHDGIQFNKWYCGHYHINRNIMGKFNILYDDVVRIV